MPTLPEAALALPAGGVTLAGDLVVPESAAGIVLFAHGSGSSRFSTRNRYVAGVLQLAGFATLLFDLLTRQEEAADARSGEYRFDIPLLAQRLAGVTEWIVKRPETTELPVGYFGASTGAAAALMAAAFAPERIAAVVSRGGRPDLAGDRLAEVRAPTLLIVGELDRSVITLNEAARRRMHARCDLVIVEGATHLFEERGTLEQAAALATDWFTRYLHAPGAS